ncbi:hypothetical protein G7Z17_g5325 [Cylindrodendrum hubeiense]|uniref:Uncharacterized protein n=1 Tax=Cylindrodendrum hubeiense TaxID=595255 RepID=A0A9P5HC90_9HYPO|nr:hypothetical protein G7Z17_g5325 [Cylindrodendrum hubeiense]
MGSKQQSPCSSEKVEAPTKPDPVARNDKSMSPPKDLGNGYQEQHLISVNVPKFSNRLQENGHVPASNVSPPERSHSPEASDRALLSPKDRAGKHQSVSSTPERTDPIVSSSISNSHQASQTREDNDLEDEGVEVSPIIPASVSTPEPMSNGQSPSKIPWANSPSPISQAQSFASPNTTDSGEMSDDEIDDEDEEPLIRSRLGKRRFTTMDHDDTRSTLEPSLEPECNNSQSPQVLAQESDDDVPMDLESPTISPQHRRDGDAHNSGTSNSSHIECPVVSTVITRSRVRSEARRAKKLAEFDSKAFDALIYQQTGSTSPSGVSVPTRSPKKVMMMKEDDRLALHVNPAIHGMHNRSEEWYQKKAKEIESRGGRKAWFGKVLERQRFVRSAEAEAEKEHQRVLRTGAMPPRRDPQPWMYKKPLDFGDIPEKDLPEDVKKNKAWLKACAWHRETNNQSRQRHVHVRRIAKEAKQHANVQRTAKEAKRHALVQGATEETNRFYMDALKSHDMYGKEQSRN